MPDTQDQGTPVGAVDVHQHLWPEELVDRLRARSRAPYLRGWTLHTDGEPPYDVDPAGHDVASRVAADTDAGVTTACLSLSAPLGIEHLPRPEAQPLIDAWHRGVAALPDHFRAWASVPAEGAGAGLAPVQSERHALRGGGRTTVDPAVFVDTSGTGPRALEAVVRVLGIDALVLGSDRPYGDPLADFLGDAALHAVRVTNPARLLATTAAEQGGEPSWAVAS